MQNQLSFLVQCYKYVHNNKSQKELLEGKVEWICNTTFYWFLKEQTFVPDILHFYNKKVAERWFAFGIPYFSAYY